MTRPGFAIVEDGLVSGGAAAVGGEGERVMFAAELDARRATVANVVRANVATTAGKVAGELGEFVTARLPTAFVIGGTHMRDVAAGESEKQF